MTEDSMHASLDAALARSGGPSAEDVAVSMLAGVRCQVLHGQIVGASCVHCLSWARTIGLPFWEPSLAAHTAAAEARGAERGARAVVEALRSGMPAPAFDGRYRDGYASGIFTAERAARSAVEQTGESDA